MTLNFNNKYGKIVLFSWSAFALFWIGIILYVFLVKANFLFLFGEMPDLDALENPKSELASELIASDQVTLGKYFRENRSPVEYEQISNNMLNALVATEDVRFENHSGIDLKGTAAIFIYLMKFDNRGSSTISQQLAKNLFNTRGKKYNGLLSKIPGIRTVIIKTKEWITAIKIERAYTKREIITMYLNTVDFGSNAFGIKVAAKTFFNTSPDSLTIPQAAMMVGVLKAPSQYSPVFNPERALKRRNTVLEQMEKYDYITSEQLDGFKKQPMALNYQVENHNKGLATYFRSVINNYLLNWCEEHDYDLYSDGLKIYTTIDSKMQKHAEDAVSQHVAKMQGLFYQTWKGRNPWADENQKEIPGFVENAFKKTDTYKMYKEIYKNDEASIQRAMHTPRKMKVFSWQGEKDTLLSPIDSLRYYKWFLQAGFMAMDPHTGHIKAWVGGIDHKYFKYDHVKQGKRQPGSTFKPFVYLAALDNGYSPCYEMQDVPVTFQFENGEETKTWTPQNSEGEFTGQTMTLRQAMARSVNSITANVMKIMGPQTVVDYAHKVGIKSELEAVPSLCLGSSDLSIYELVGAYSTFVNHGVHTEPFYITRIEDKNGNIIQEFIPKTTEALNEETAYLMVNMLKGSSEEKGGSALGLRRYPIFDGGNEVGGKTGTTSNYSDGWFMGINESLVAGAWVGGDDRCIHFTSYTHGQGSKLALPIVGMFYDKTFNDKKTGVKRLPFSKPRKPLTVEIDCKKYKQGSKNDSTSSSYQNPGKPNLD